MTISLQPKQPASADLVRLLRSLLSAQLGTFANGKQALWVEPPQAPPVGTGLHVYAQRYYIQLTATTYQWQVALVMHGEPGGTPASSAVYEANLQKFDQAIALMRQKFPQRREAIIPYREDLPPQATFQIVVTQLLSNQRLLVST